MTRVIKGLKWARELPCRPSFIPKARPRGVKASGCRYEQALAKALPWGVHGQWFEFEDSQGHGFCQTDVLIEREMYALVLEAKLSYTSEAFEQLEGLYKPVVEKALKKPMFGVQVCLRLRAGARPGLVSGSLPGALRIARDGGNATFHWLGKSAIVGLELPKASPIVSPQPACATRTHIDIASRVGL